MKLTSLAPICLLLACSSPRYLYRFPEPAGAPIVNHSSAAKEPEPNALVSPEVSTAAPVVYSADIAAPKPAPSRRIRIGAENPVVKQASHPAGKMPPAEDHLDGDLKRAIIFAAAGAVALIIGGQVFYVAGSLSLLIGLIFGIKWFSRR